MKRSGRSRAPARSSKTLDADDALVAVLIGAMEASGHASAEEAARAHDIIWATRRFRRRSGEAVGRRIEGVRRRVRDEGVEPVVDAAARALPRALRPAAFAIAADIVLVDGRIARAEARFLDGLAARLGLAKADARRIRDVLRIKNGV